MYTTRVPAAQAQAAAARPQPSIFAIYAPDLIARGYSPLPRIIKGGHGRPAVKSWSDWCEKQPGKLQLESWARIPGADISLACGFRGLIAIDVDDDRPEILAAVRKALPQCTVARRGSKGFVLLARHADGPQQTINVYRAEEAQKDPLVEIMGIGRSITIPPSIHAKTGMHYQWIDPGTGKPRPAEWLLPALDELPVITAADIESLIAALAPWSRKPKPPRTKIEGPAPVLTDATSKRYRAYAQKGLANSTAGLAALTEGRPSELFRAACGLGWAVAHRVITETEFVNAFATACETNGLAARDGRRAIEASIHSGLQKAANDPLPQLEDRPRDQAAERIGGRRRRRRSEKRKKPGRSATSATPATFQDDPLPLFRELPKAEAFPVEALGATLGGMAKALHEAAVQSPLPLCGTSVLAAATCATQALRNVELPIADGQTKPLSLDFVGNCQERRTQDGDGFASAYAHPHALRGASQALR